MSRLEDRLAIEPDGTIVARSGKVELGQGIRRAFARLVAAGLHVPVERVRIELGDTATAPWDMGTFGSLSTRTDGALLARAAVFARQLLDAGKPLTGEIPDALPIATPGDSPDPDDDARAIVTGAMRFAGDLRTAGMRYGRVLHPPAHGATLAALDDRAARGIPGVDAVVRDGDFAGVVAEHAAQARTALGALVAEWRAAPPRPRSERRLVLRDDAGVTEALARAAHAIDASYDLPHVANAPLGPSAALADVRGDIATIHAATQRPFGVRDDVARLLGVAPERVRVIAAPAAGSFGRNNSSDAAIEAVRLSRAVGRPVLVQWSRADELHAAPNRPRLSARIRAGLDASGRLVAWSSNIATNPHVYFGELSRMPDEIVAMTCARNAVPAYRLGAARVEVAVAPAPIRTAALRSLSAAPNVFAIESAIDELAAAAKLDPLELRLRNIEDRRLRRVLECVAERSDWAHRSTGGARGLGIACAIYNGTYVAQVAEVEVTPRLRVRRAWCALDCGTVVDPDGARNQIEGSIVHALSWSLIEQLRTDGPRVTASSWDDYPIARFHDAPDAIETVFTDDGRTPPTGVGEPGAVPFGAAIANAVAASSGRRVRVQPLAL